MRGERWKEIEEINVRREGGALCSCFHLKLDSDHYISSSLLSSFTYASGGFSSFSV